MSESDIEMHAALIRNALRETEYADLSYRELANATGLTKPQVKRATEADDEIVEVDRLGSVKFDLSAPAAEAAKYGDQHE